MTPIDHANDIVERVSCARNLVLFHATAGLIFECVAVVKLLIPRVLLAGVVLALEFVKGYRMIRVMIYDNFIGRAEVVACTDVRCNVADKTL